MASPALPAPALARPAVRNGRPGAGRVGAPTPGPVPAPVPVAGRWAGAGAACLTAMSLVLHVVMLVSGGHGLFLGLALAAMALACAGCAAHAVMRPGCQGSRTLVAMSAGMALVHAVLVLGIPGGPGLHAMHDGGAHHSGAGGTGAGSAHADLMLVVVGLELAVAWLAGFSVHRVRAASRGKMPS